MNAKQLSEALRNNLSPHAIALIHAQLHFLNCDSEAVSEVYWFARQLVGMVGGYDAMNKLYEEVGI